MPWTTAWSKFTLYIYIFSRNQMKKIYNTAKELYYDATIFVFWFFIVYMPKKKLKLKNGPRLSTLPYWTRWAPSVWSVYRCIDNKINNNVINKKISTKFNPKSIWGRWFRNWGQNYKIWNSFRFPWNLVLGLFRVAEYEFGFKISKF